RAPGPAPGDARHRRRARPLPPVRVRGASRGRALHGMGALDRLTANQRSWMEAVASATGGSTFEIDGVTCVHQPLPNRELLVPFPRRPPTAAVLDRAREVG